jgi:hypothetical protein
VTVKDVDMSPKFLVNRLPSGERAGLITTRRVGGNGGVSFAGCAHPIGCGGGRRSVCRCRSDQLLAPWGVGGPRPAASSRPRGTGPAAGSQRRRPPPRKASVRRTLTCKVDSSGSISFAGASYRVTGYTSITEVRGDEAAADLATRLATLVRRALGNTAGSQSRGWATA